MVVFDDVIRKTRELLGAYEPAQSRYAPQRAAAESGRDALVMKKEAAFELGEGSFPSVAFTAFTESAALVPEDRVLVYGDDLKDIKADTAFARVTLLRTGAVDDGDDGAYKLIKDMELRKFSLHPEGYMVRASAFTNREQVRVAKTALKAGLGFFEVGCLYIKKYKEDPNVRAAEVLFITLPEAPYAALDGLADSAVNITRALNHAVARLDIDCPACAWKPVCDTVEGMKEEHERQIERRV